MIRMKTQAIYGSSWQGKGEQPITRGSGAQRTRATDDEVSLRKSEQGEDAYTRLTRLTRQKMSSATGSEAADASHALHLAFNSLPRNSDGAVDPEVLVDEDRLTSLSEAVERLVLEGFGSGAEVAFEHAIAKLFSDYADDLQLDESELARAQDLMIKDVKDVVANHQIRPWDPSEPAPASMDLHDEIKQLQERVLLRRRLMLEASGDLSRVLSELTTEAQNGGEAEYSELGQFLERFGEATRARSSTVLRESARSRLLSSDPLMPSQPDASTFGEAFIKKVEAAQG